LGFEEPYLKAQVKRQKSTVGSPDMQQFTGALNQGEKGLYVATGGYTSGARHAANESSNRITLVDREGFIDLLIDHYEELEPEYQSLVPLKPVYIPTQDPPIQE
jgi:restriction system protein